MTNTEYTDNPHTLNKVTEAFRSSSIAMYMRRGLLRREATDSTESLALQFFGESTTLILFLGTSKRMQCNHIVKRDCGK